MLTAPGTWPLSNSAGGTHIEIDGVRVLLQSVIGLLGIDLFDAHEHQLY